MIPGHLIRTAVQMVDSTLETTRIYWRETYFAATPEEARDPRPFAEVVAERGAAA